MLRVSKEGMITFSWGSRKPSGSWRKSLIPLGEVEEDGRSTQMEQPCQVGEYKAYWEVRTNYSTLTPSLHSYQSPIMHFYSLNICGVGKRETERSQLIQSPRVFWDIGLWSLECHWRILRKEDHDLPYMVNVLLRSQMGGEETSLKANKHSQMRDNGSWNPIVPRSKLRWVNEENKEQRRSKMMPRFVMPLSWVSCLHRRSHGALRLSWTWVTRSLQTHRGKDTTLEIQKGSVLMELFMFQDRVEPKHEELLAFSFLCSFPQKYFPI